jgi:hypothetical protein
VRLLALILFYGYVGLLVVAGAWGVIGARLDHRWLFAVDAGSLGAPRSAASIVSQYRFLRALELGFGIWALMFRHRIFTEPPYARLFLGVMSTGVIARVISHVLDGRARGIFYFFLWSEAAGAVCFAIAFHEALGF